MTEKTPVISLSLDEAQIAKAEALYSSEMVDNDNPYVSWMAKHDGTTIVCYAKKDKQGKRKLVFQGEDVSSEASLFGDVPHSGEPRKEIIKGRKTSPYHFFPEIGSDEVGTGDLFGPICVVAAYLDEEGYIKAQKLGITDSKKMSDDYILEIGPTLVKEFDYSSLSLDNQKYNEVHEKGGNMNSIKAKMHNAVLLNLKKKHPSARVYQDQFAEPRLYYSYLKYEKEVLKDITFSTKGELAYASVALASVLARYSFLKKMEQMSKHYGVDIPFGAGATVTQFAKEFKEKFGEKELRKVAKLNFKNIKDILK
ncbi:MAG: ribonuclease HIII [Bacilli bacterium]|nr:ribonuclease HIII [Bacilli bacterium]